MANYESAIEFKNLSTSTIHFVLEPWGNEYQLNPGDVIRLSFESEKMATIPIQHEENEIIVEILEHLNSKGIWINGALVG